MLGGFCQVSVLDKLWIRRRERGTLIIPVRRGSISLQPSVCQSPPKLHFCALYHHPLATAKIADLFNYLILTQQEPLVYYQLLRLCGNIPFAEGSLLT